MEKDLILHNDNVHSFDYVRGCLIRFCNHAPLQAEQCIILAHNNGKCHIKRGDVLEMIQMQQVLQNYKLTVSLEDLCYQ
jgi:ATP-dependent Clp protease adaptor protein ClpS